MKSFARYLATLSILFLISCTDQGQQKTTIPVDEFEKGILAGSVQLLDARTADEYNSGHLKGALLADWLQKDQFKDRTHYLDKNKPVYVYCLSGSRSTAAGEWMRQQGFTHVFNMEGGITAWKKAGKPVEGASTQPQMGDEAYTKLINKGPLVLVDYGAIWCSPCKMMDPILEKVVKEHGSEFKLARVDGGLETELMKTYKVEALPTFIIYKSGRETWRHQGVLTEDELVKTIQKFR